MCNLGCLLMDSFKLDNYFTKEYLYKTLEKKQVNTLLEIDTFIKRIKDFLNEYSNSSVMYGQGQTYNMIIRFTNTDYCTLTWDIDKVKFIIEKFDIPVKRLNGEFLATTIAKNAIDPAYLIKAQKNNEPIIVASLPMINSCAVIDGNHRVISKLQQGIKVINGYYLDPQYHYFAMLNDTSRALFLALTYTENIKRYLIGEVPKSDLIEGINELDSFYDMSVEKEMIDTLDNAGR